MEKSCHQNQDRAKSWKKQFSNSFLIELWIEKSRHQNQDRPKSWKNQFSNTFLIEFWIEQSRHQNQDRAKSWKNQFSNIFLNWNLKKKWKWNLCRGTIKMLNTHQIVYIYETVQLEPPPPSVFFQNQWTMYKNSIYKYMCPNRIYIYMRNRSVRTPPLTISVFSKINELCRKFNIHIKKYIYIFIFALKHKLPKAKKNQFFNTL